MKTWKVAVTWEMCGYIDIEADNMEEAMKSLRMNRIISNFLKMVFMLMAAFS